MAAIRESELNDMAENTGSLLVTSKLEKNEC